jgi:glucose/arabinose dehydrogenase
MAIEKEEIESENITGKFTFAPTLTDWLGYLYKPLLPMLERIQFQREGPRGFNPADILLPEGFVAEVVATGFHAPVHCCFDTEGNCYVAESGHKIDSRPRILKVNVETGQYSSIYEVPDERWHKKGALTGLCWHEGYLYFANTDSISRINPDGVLEDIVTGLPGLGDHQTNYPLIGPDGKLYFGQGCVTNSGVVGADNFAYGWLSEHPSVCEVPAEDIRLSGRNYDYQNVLGDLNQSVRSGAYVPFGTETFEGQVIPGNVKCSGSILRCNPDGSELEVVAWGLRNPYGIAFHPDGRLFATEHGMDERSQRYIVSDPDDFYEIQDGSWYGWPDFASGIRLDAPYWDDGGHGREPVLAEFPDPYPPMPFLSFDTHTAANGVDFCRDAAFGFYGDAFVALFGDLAPLTTVRHAISPAGFKVVRIDMANKRVVDFAVNKISGPASKLPHEGFERPSHCQFGPDGSLYVVDFGAIRIALETGGIQMQKDTGSLWRIRRVRDVIGSQPAAAISFPLYLSQYLAILGGIVAVFAGIFMVKNKVQARREKRRGFFKRWREANPLIDSIARFIEQKTGTR